MAKISVLIRILFNDVIPIDLLIIAFFSLWRIDICYICGIQESHSILWKHLSISLALLREGIWRVFGNTQTCCQWSRRWNLPADHRDPGHNASPDGKWGLCARFCYWWNRCVLLDPWYKQRLRGWSDQVGALNEAVKSRVMIYLNEVDLF